MYACEGKIRRQCGTSPERGWGFPRLFTNPPTFIILRCIRLLSSKILNQKYETKYVAGRVKKLMVLPSFI